MKDSFSSRLLEAILVRDSPLCIGLDPHPARLPSSCGPSLEPIARTEYFLSAIIDSTHDLVASYKLNLAFFEILGDGGWSLLERLIRRIPDGVVTIADAKRGDIGNSARFYAESVFTHLGFDAVTVSPYMGGDSVFPFLDYEGKGVFVLVRTSNPGGSDFQELSVDGLPLYMHVAREAQRWCARSKGDIGFVVGATDINALAAIAGNHPDVPLLVPGVGAQGGDPAAVLARGVPGRVLINSSRGILYAGTGTHFAEESRIAATDLLDLLRNASAHTPT